MKKNVNILLLITLIFLLNINLYSQDILMLKNGDSIEVKIKEVIPELVKYKKFNYLNGPIYSVEKINIKMILYQNGDKEVFGGKEVFGDKERSAQKSKELLPSSRVFLRFKETEGEKSVDSFSALKKFKEYLSELIHCEVVDSKKNADFIFELYLFKRLGAKREAKIKVIHILSGDIMFETNWKKSKGSSSVIVKTIGEGLIRQYPNIGKYNL